jgi:signal transduction histidine kinase
MFKMGLVALSFFIVGKAVGFLPLDAGEIALVRPLGGMGLAILLCCGFRFWPGILLGLMALHSDCLLGNGAFVDHMILLGGEFVMCIAGYGLVRWVYGNSSVYESESTLWKFLAVALPLGLITPVFQGGLNFFMGGRFCGYGAYSCFYSWMGESLGIFILTPILCLWFKTDRSQWRERPKLVTLPLVGTLLIVLTLYVHASQSELGQIQHVFFRESELVVSNLEKRFHHYGDHLIFVERFFAGSDFVTQKEFNIFLSTFLRDRPGVTVQWAPRMVRPETTGDSFPVTYCEPAVEKQAWADYDWGSNSNLFPLKSKGIGGETLSSIQPGLPSSRGLENQLIMIKPVYKKHPSEGTTDSPPRGIVAMIFRIRDFTMDSDNTQDLGINYSLAEKDGPTFDSLPPSPTPHPLTQTLSFYSMGQTWEVKSWMEEASFRKRRSWTVPWMFIGGLFFAGVFGALLIVVTGRNLRIKSVVEEKTKELQTANIELNRHIADREGIERMKTDFISSVSHELRTPLTSIKGYLQIIVSDKEMPENVRGEFLGIVLEEADRLNYLVEDLLEISRLESTAVKLTVTNVDLNDLANTVSKSLRPLAEKKKLRLEVDVKENLGTVEAHPGKLRSLMTNLLSNALKFTLTENALVTLRIRSDETHAHIEVSDAGIGIPKEDLSRIFDRFYRVERQGIQIQGTGLGLAIVKRIVDLHHGEISALSELGKGTTFIVILPRRYIDDSEGGSTFDSTNI